MAIYFGNELDKKLKYKLDNPCSNNQAEQLAIFKALESLETTLGEIDHVLQEYSLTVESPWIQLGT